MNTGTAQAWLVRKAQRQKLIEEIMVTLTQNKEGFRSDYLERIILHLVLQRLILGELSNSSDSYLLHDISENEQTHGVVLFQETCAKIQKFQRSEKEGNYLLSNLLEWAIAGIVGPHRLALQVQETLKPQLIYNAAHAMDLVPRT